MPNVFSQLKRVTTMCLIELDLFDTRSNKISRIYFVSFRMFHVQTFVLIIYKQKSVDSFFLLSNLC